LGKVKNIRKAYTDTLKVTSTPSAANLKTAKESIRKISDKALTSHLQKTLEPSLVKIVNNDSGETESSSSTKKTSKDDTKSAASNGMDISSIITGDYGSVSMEPGIKSRMEPVGFKDNRDFIGSPAMIILHLQ
jgi:predicted flavoprotein YhiN